MDDVTRAFHDRYYQSNVWRDTYWHGTPVLKCPFDRWIYQEIVTSVRPALVIECGTWAGGSALFVAHMFDIIGNGRIITIDVLDADQVGAHYAQYTPGSAANLRIRPQHRVSNICSGPAPIPQSWPRLRTRYPRRAQSW